MSWVPVRCWLIGALAIGFASTASATTLTLSDLSSEPSIPASILNATLDFTVTGGRDRDLVLAVTNDTTSPNEFNMNQIYFNSSDKVTGLELISAISSFPEGDVTSLWMLEASDQQMGGNTRADGFGIFDWLLWDGVNGQVGTIMPGETVTFTLVITGNAVNMDDFAAEFSMSLPGLGNTLALAVGKFITGPGDDSAFGAVIPEPAALQLLGLGLFGLALVARSKRR